MTVEPRIVEVRVNYSKKDAEYDMVVATGKRKFPEETEVISLFSSTPVPAPLQVCREARKHLETVFYQRTFHDLGLPGVKKAGEEKEEVDGEETKQKDDEPKPQDEGSKQNDEKRKQEHEAPKSQNNKQRTPPSPSPAPQHDQRPYIYLSSHDLLSIGPSLFSHFHPYASHITALRFQRELPFDSDNEVNPEERATILADLRLVSSFVKVKEIHIICSHGQDVQDWGGIETELGIKFPCGKQRVLVINPGDDLVVEAGEIDIYD